MQKVLYDTKTRPKVSTEVSAISLIVLFRRNQKMIKILHFLYRNFLLFVKLVPKRNKHFKSTQLVSCSMMQELLLEKLTITSTKNDKLVTD